MKFGCTKFGNALSAGLVAAWMGLPQAEKAQAAEPVRYALLPGSVTVDQCALCDHAPLLESTTGSFTLRLIDRTFPNEVYAIEGLVFQTFLGGIPRRSGTGSGTLVLGGDFALTQSMELEVHSDDGSGVRISHLKSATMIAKMVPDFRMQMQQTDGTMIHSLNADWIAEPQLEAKWRWVSVGATEGVVAWDASLGSASVQRRSPGGASEEWTDVKTAVASGPVEFIGRFPLTGSGGLYRLRWSSR